MSDHYTILIPTDPQVAPTKDKQLAAESVFRQLAPEADGIVSRLTDTVQFIGAGSNFESIGCTECKAPISQDWWGKRMDDDFDRKSGFKLALYTLPCCGARKALHQLDYQWPQGFARYALEAMNANIGEVSASQKAALEAALGTELMVIYRHM